MSGDIHLSQINFVVGDMDASAAFYSRLGLDLTDGGMPEWRPHHRSTETSGADVDLDSAAFAAEWDAGWPGGSGIVVTFRVPSRDDVDRLFDELTLAGHPAQQPPYDAFWGARYAVVADPDGNAVGLMSPADSTRRSQVAPPPVK